MKNYFIQRCNIIAWLFKSYCNFVSEFKVEILESESLNSFWKGFVLWICLFLACVYWLIFITFFPFISLLLKYEHN
jgi:hypothetical protein